MAPETEIGKMAGRGRGRGKRGRPQKEAQSTPPKLVKRVKKMTEKMQALTRDVSKPQQLDTSREKVWGKKGNPPNSVSLTPRKSYAWKGTNQVDPDYLPDPQDTHR